MDIQLLISRERSRPATQVVFKAMGLDGFAQDMRVVVNKRNRKKKDV